MKVLMLQRKPEVGIPTPPTDPRRLPRDQCMPPRGGQACLGVSLRSRSARPRAPPETALRSVGDCDDNERIVADDSDRAYRSGAAANSTRPRERTPDHYGPQRKQIGAGGQPHRRRVGPINLDQERIS